jgi:hypothetical protein
VKRLRLPRNLIELRLFSQGLWNEGRIAGGIGLVVVLVTCGIMAAAGFQRNPTPSHHVLQHTYSSIKEQMNANNQAHFPSKATIERYMRASGANILEAGSFKQAYGNLLHNGGHEGTVYIRLATPDKLELIGRVHHDELSELDATDLGVVRTYGIYNGHFNLGLFKWMASSELLLALLAGVGFGTKLGREKIALQRRWRDGVKDRRFGPDMPQGAFTIIQPYCVDRDGAVHIYAEPLEWSYASWQVDHHRSYRIADLGFRSITIPHADGVAKATEAWFDFCKRAAEYNASQWAQTQASARAQQQRAIERREVAQTVLVEKSEIAPHLPSAHAVYDAVPLDHLEV